MRKSILFIIISFFIFNVETHSQAYNQIDSIDFYNAVETGLQKYLNKIPVNREYLFGFNSRDEFDRIRLGFPLQILNIYENSYTESNPQEIFHLVNKWKIPLLIDGNYICFLDIVLSDSEYKAVGIGLCELAHDLDSYEKQKGLKTIENRVLFLDYSLAGYCIGLPNINEEYDFMFFRPDFHYDFSVDVKKDKYSDLELFEIFKKKNVEHSVFNF